MIKSTLKIMLFLGIIFASVVAQANPCSILDNRAGTRWLSPDEKMNALLYYHPPGGSGLSGGFGFEGRSAPLILSSCGNGNIKLQWNRQGFKGTLSGTLVSGTPTKIVNISGTINDKPISDYSLVCQDCKKP